MSETTTVGYLGLDHHHAAPYLQSLARLPVEVTCAAEPDESFTVDSVDPLPTDATLYRDYEALLDAEDVDVAWITLSNRETPDVVRAAAERGIDVYAEKPMARTAADLEPVVDAVERHGVTLAASYPWRGHPVARELRSRAAAGFFGDVRGLFARFVASGLEHRDTDHYLFDAGASRGGILQWLGVHWIDLVPWILDDPIVRVTATEAHGSDAVDVEDGMNLLFETASGALGTLQSGYYLREGQYDTAVEIYGTAGRASWDPMGRTFGFDGSTTLELDSGDDSWASSPHRTISYDYEPTPGYGGRWGLEFMQAFLDARTGDGRVGADLDDALRVLRVLDAAYESAREDRPVRVEGQ